MSLRNPSRQTSPARLLAILVALGLIASACGASATNNEASTGVGGLDGELVIGAIPDQDPEVLARNYELLADYLSTELDLDVRFQPVTEYDAAVTGFRVGDLDLVWFGGLTGVQARLQVDGANAIAQRDIDQRFTSVFIANVEAGIGPLASVEDLGALADHTFTFGSESSTSGRLMPQSFLAEAGLTLDSFKGEPGFSGSHDQTIALVEAGTFDAGVLNSQVWQARLDEGVIGSDKVQVILETPEYFDYHWVARPELAELETKITEALVGLDPAVAAEAEILGFFGAESFIETSNENYADIEQVGREIGRITD